jgi:hypothetical protein
MRTPIAAASGCVHATIPFVEYTGDRLLFHLAVLTFFFSMMKLNWLNLIVPPAVLCVQEKCRQLNDVVC